MSRPIQPPAASPTSGLTADGTIDSIIFAPGIRWTATGNWSMVIRIGSVNSFNTNMTWYNDNGTGSHTHELLNFKPTSANEITITPSDNNIFLKGLVDVRTNHRITWKNVHGTIDIKVAKTISISLDDNIWA